MAKQLLGYTMTGAITVIITEHTGDGAACCVTRTALRSATRCFPCVFSAITCGAIHRKEVPGKPRAFESTLSRNFLNHSASVSTCISVI